LQKFAGQDCRSIGEVGEVIEAVLADGSLFKHVFAGIVNANGVLRRRWPI
jgi:hypothetical protein